MDISQLPPQNQLDFWLGEWDVSWGDGQPDLDLAGRSVSVYRPQFGQWQQIWVDSQGSYWHLRGGWNEGRFTLLADDIVRGRAVKFRMVFYNITADAFDWIWELSEDEGQTWTLRWKIHYQRRGGPA